MFDRKVAIIKNTKCYMSPDYVRRIMSIYKGRNKFYSKTNKKNILSKIETSQNIDISKEQPLVLFNKSKKKDLNIENEIKKELIENQGYLNITALKKNLMKFYSQNIYNENNKKNLFKVKNKTKTNSNLYQTLDTYKRNIRKEYSNSLRKRIKSNSAKKSGKKNYMTTDNELNRKRSEYDNIFDKNKLMDEEFIKKLLPNEYDKKNKNDIMEKKKDYLEHNNISYENVDIKDIENEKNKEKEKIRKVIIFKDGKYIKKIKLKQEVQNNKKPNNIKIKNHFDGLEYINKIKEMKNLK